jgi:hypothetical protein
MGFPLLDLDQYFQISRLQDDYIFVIKPFTYLNFSSFQI